jgi:hypothetical protein
MCNYFFISELRQKGGGPGFDFLKQKHEKGKKKLFFSRNFDVNKRRPPGFIKKDTGNTNNLNDNVFY